MTDLAKPLRERLAAEAHVTGPTVVRDTTAGDGTRKWLLDAGNGNAVESVYIPEDDRGTLCISSQAGCALDCAFCSTGKQGFNRNLTTAEIIGQLWHANRTLLADGVTAPWIEQGRPPITNVVMMGMGEPLANFDNVVPALRLMLDDHAYGLSRRRVTLSTSGLVPQIDRLREECPVALAVSLHAPNDALRDRIVPINRTHPLRELLAACVRYLDVAPRDFITFEYVMLDGVNDQPGHAAELLALTRDVPCKFNLIPFNPFPGSEFRTSPRERIVALPAHAAGRRPRGDDPQDARRRHRRRVRAARGPGAGPHQAPPVARASCRWPCARSRNARGPDASSPAPPVAAAGAGRHARRVRILVDVALVRPPRAGAGAAAHSAAAARAGGARALPRAAARGDRRRLLRARPDGHRAAGARGGGQARPARTRRSTTCTDWSTRRSGRTRTRSRIS